MKTNNSLVRQLKSIILKAFGVLILLLIVAFLGAKIWINSEVQNMAKEAQNEFKLDKVESLIAYVESENYTLGQRNNAVWALGNLKDKRALPFLQMLYTGEECNHQEALCQYEIKKAIDKIN